MSMRDDRLPILLVVLDGLGDRACSELSDRTPCEAAATPNLDALTTQGACGVHVPFGPGRATSSEYAHWALFGFSGVPFPGRAAIEALGVGL
jgi:2,3-bisphosphoglycerate-independent phosphoglycerate mutase